METLLSLLTDFEAYHYLIFVKYLVRHAHKDLISPDRQVLGVSHIYGRRVKHFIAPDNFPKLAETKSYQHMRNCDIFACQKPHKQASILIEGKGGKRMRREICDISEEKIVVGTPIASKQS